LTQDNSGSLLPHITQRSSWNAKRLPLQAASFIYKYRYVWSAAELQAKTENDVLVCANVFGLVGVNDPGPGWNPPALFPT
jgi:hypothetical protein